MLNMNELAIVVSAAAIASMSIAAPCAEEVFQNPPHEANIPTGAFNRPAQTLEEGFLSPPDSAKPQTWYHMMNGNVTKESWKASIGLPGPAEKQFEILPQKPQGVFVFETLPR